MVFKRREQQKLWDRLRGWVYPRSGWRRALEYLGHRIKRLPDSPHRISVGIAAGVFASFSPFFGLHFLYAALWAWICRGNILASLVATIFGNPVTFPFIAAISLKIGRTILGLEPETGGFGAFKDALFDAVGGLWMSTKSMFGFGPSAWDRLAVFFHELFLPYLVGGILPGLIAGITCYFVSRPLISAYQKRRRHKILSLAKVKAAG